MAFTHPLLERLGILGRFQAVVAGDTLPEKKPHPAPLRHAAAQLGLDIADCAMIGDSASDIKASQAAGCICVCVGYGYNQGMDLAQLNPEYLVDDFAAAVDSVLKAGY
jgi:phosphoglycolate phosphatase